MIFGHFGLLIFSILQKKFQNFDITFTGHSLGGALASLAAARTAKQGFRSGSQIKVYTFGQPRVGNVQFARNFDAILPNTYRVVFRRDIVPHMPACHKNQTFISEHEGGAKPCHAEHQDYYHHGTEIWYPDEMSAGAHYVECLGAPKNEDFGCSDRIKFFVDQSDTYTWDHRHYFGVKVRESYFLKGLLGFCLVRNILKLTTIFEKKESVNLIPKQPSLCCN